jgi:hypothetical protein
MSSCKHVFSGPMLPMGVRADGNGSERYVRVSKPEARKKGNRNLIRSLFIIQSNLVGR